MLTSNLQPIAYVLTATNHGTLVVNRHDYGMVRGRGYGVGCQLLGTSSYEVAEVDLALGLLQERRQQFGNNVMAIDCGANIGVHTVEWARHMYGWGEVLAIEAQERIFYALAGNIAINNCFNARAVWAAVGAKSGTIHVPTPDYHSPANFGSLEIRKTDKTEFIGQEVSYTDRLVETRMMAIDDLALPRIDFIKIDIEGMEMEALAGAAESIARCRPQLMIEKIKSNEKGLTDFLAQREYRVFSFGRDVVAMHNSDPTASKVKVNT
ncbi:MAG: FkbM family methyltransferase [Bryobacteraceae bacterium]